MLSMYIIIVIVLYVNVMARDREPGRVSVNM